MLRERVDYLVFHRDENFKKGTDPESLTALNDMISDIETRIKLLEEKKIPSSIINKSELEDQLGYYSIA